MSNPNKLTAEVATTIRTCSTLLATVAFGLATEVSQASDKLMVGSAWYTAVAMASEAVKSFSETSSKNLSH